MSSPVGRAPRRAFHWSLRARLIVALVGVALLGTTMATVYSTVTLKSHVSEAARARLQRSATHFGDAAGVVYAESGGWTPATRMVLHHLAQVDGLAVRLVDSSGAAVLELTPSGPVQPGASASAPVTQGGRQLGSVTVSQANGQLLTPEEVHLTHHLNQMHLLAGITAAAVALVIAFLLALSLSRPLRQIRAGAEAMGAGDLDARVQEGGDDEMRAIARALNRLAETLQHEEELRKASVADLAHELRTPVMGLLGRIEAAQDGVFADQAANLAAMHDEAARLTHLLDDLSALADAERPGLLLTTTPVDLAAVAADQVAAFADRFADKGIGLTSDLRPVVVDGDRRRLEQITVNLLANALKYTDAGGGVKVSVRSGGGAAGGSGAASGSGAADVGGAASAGGAAGDDGPRVAEAGSRTGTAVLEVTDTGIGIPAADLPNVFTRFWRGEKSRSRETGGAGIGLAIVKALVSAHGGRITVTSKVGVGSTFRVELPAAPTPNASATAPN